MSKTVKIVIALVVIIVLVVLAIQIGVNRSRNKIDVIETREAKLYATTIENVPIFKDNTNKLWEIPGLNVTAEDSILIEIKNGETSRVWIEVNINGDEEIPES